MGSLTPDQRARYDHLSALRKQHARRQKAADSQQILGSSSGASTQPSTASSENSLALTASTASSSTALVSFSADTTSYVDSTKLVRMSRVPASDISTGCENIDAFIQAIDSSKPSSSHPVSEEDLEAAWAAQLKNNMTWKDACKQFCTETSRIARPPASEKPFPKKVIHPKWCGFCACKENNPALYDAHLRVQLSFDLLIKNVGGLNSLAETDVLLRFEQEVAVSGNIHKNQYFAWLTAPMGKYSNHASQQVFILCYESGHASDGSDSLEGMLLTDSTWAHVDCTFDKLPLSNDQIVKGPLAQHSEQQMAKKLCRTSILDGEVKAIVITRLLFEDVTTSTVKVTGLCDKVGTMRVELTVKAASGKRPSSGAKLSLSAPSASSSAASSSAPSPPLADSDSIDYLAMLDDEPPLELDPMQQEAEANASDPTALELDRMILDHTKMLETAWDEPGAGDDELVRDPELNDAEFKILQELAVESRYEHALKSHRELPQRDFDEDFGDFECDGLTNLELSGTTGDDNNCDIDIHIDKDNDNECEADGGSRQTVTASSSSSSNGNGHDVNTPRDPSHAVSAQTSTTFIRPTLGEVRVVRHPHGVVLYDVSCVSPGSNNEISIGKIKLMVNARNGKATLLAECASHKGKRCRCWSGTQHEDQLIEWLLQGPTCTYAMHHASRLSVSQHE